MQAEAAVDVSADPEMRKDRGYFWGYSFGDSLRQSGNIDVDLQSVMEGLQDMLSGKEPRLSPEQQQTVVQLIRTRQVALQEAMQTQQEQMVTSNLANAIAFLEENAAKPNIKTTKSGLQYEMLVEGTGGSPRDSDKVSVHYEGTFANGEVFDSSIQRDEAAEFGLNQVIPGWTEGLQLMRVGGKARFYVHPELGYGPGGRPGIPPNSLLIFEVELLNVL